MFENALGGYMALILVFVLWTLIAYGVMYRFKSLVKDAVREAIKESCPERRENE